jgi:hypothetical protein
MQTTGEKRKKGRQKQRKKETKKKRAKENKIHPKLSTTSRVGRRKEG